jgi:hypothetical protein
MEGQSSCRLRKRDLLLGSGSTDVNRWIRDSVRNGGVSLLEAMAWRTQMGIRTCGRSARTRYPAVGKGCLHWSSSFNSELNAGFGTGDEGARAQGRKQCTRICPAPQQQSESNRSVRSA